MIITRDGQPVARLTALHTRGERAGEGFGLREATYTELISCAGSGPAVSTDQRKPGTAGLL
ncbi:MAG: hypothetical protein GX195_02265 [Firmicutes bacterium]|nr:hypothetical protein [Bacillota bacterium]